MTLGTFAFPEPREDDDDDVVWALQAGNTEWHRGAHAEAVVWLRRGIDAANAAGNAFRAGDLKAAVDELTEVLWATSDSAASEVPLEDLDDAELLDDFTEIIAEDVEVEVDSVEIEASELVSSEEAWNEMSGLAEAVEADPALYREVMPDDVEARPSYAEAAGAAPGMLEAGEGDAPWEDRVTLRAEAMNPAAAQTESSKSTPAGNTQIDEPLTLERLQQALEVAAAGRAQLDTVDYEKDAEQALESTGRVELDSRDYEESAEQELESTGRVELDSRDYEESAEQELESTGRVELDSRDYAEIAEQVPNSANRLEFDGLDYEESAEQELKSAGRVELDSLDYEDSVERELKATGPLELDNLDDEVSAEQALKRTVGTENDSRTENDSARDPKSHPPAPAGAASSKPPARLRSSLPARQNPLLESDIESLVSSVHPPTIDRGLEPIDEFIAQSLSSSPPPFVSAREFVAEAEPLPPSLLLDGVALNECPGFEDLPEESLLELVSAARLESLRGDEEVSGFGAVLVTHGAVSIVPEVGEEPGALATKGDVVFTQGTLDQGTHLRVVSTADNTVVAVWSAQDLARVLADSPWVHDELRRVADRFQALAGATLGALGERFDAAMRRLVTDRMEVRSFGPNEVIVTQGAAVPGLFIVGAGRVDLLDDKEGGRTLEQHLSGDFLFAQSVMAGGKAPYSAHAGEQGALVLFAPRMVAHELMTSVPPLLEILAS